MSPPPRRGYRPRRDRHPHSPAPLATEPPQLTRLTFHGPSPSTAPAGLAERLARTGPATVLDIGCGWGELMLRVLEAVPGATGVGVDLKAEDLARGRRAAEERGLAGRVRFLEESATGTSAARPTWCCASGPARP